MTLPPIGFEEDVSPEHLRSPTPVGSQGDFFLAVRQLRYICGGLPPTFRAKPGIPCPVQSCARLPLPAGRVNLTLVLSGSTIPGFAVIVCFQCIDLPAQSFRKIPGCATVLREKEPCRTHRRARTVWRPA